MPLLKSAYKAPWYFQNTHFQTIFAGALRPAKEVRYQTERLITPDEDFLDIEWLRSDNSRLAVVTHGMCGSARAAQVTAIATALHQVGFDVLAINFRGSGREVNRSFRTYHSGETGDLRFVIKTILERKIYEEISLTGYSLGGNVILKYLGEEGQMISPFIKSAAVMSVPVDLAGSEREMRKWKNKHYILNFNVGVRRLLQPKTQQFPQLLQIAQIKKARNLADFANIYVAPAFGFKDADDYHAKASSLPYLKHISIPVLLIQALDDSILSPECFPYQIAEESNFLHLEISKNGGHAGFVQFGNDVLMWSERRIRDFLLQHSAAAV